MSLGEKIQDLRKQINLSQEELAEKLSVSRQAVSKWELDQATPDINKIIQLSKFFNISTDSLLNDDMDIKLSHIKSSTLNKENISSNPYEHFIGRWVKIFLNDHEFKGLYQVALLAISKDYILFHDRKGKKGILSVKSIISMSDADIYKRNPEKAAPISLENMSDKNFIEYFQGKHCQVRLICDSLLNSFHAFFDVIVEKITDNEILIKSTKTESIVKLDKILMITEF